MKLKKKIGVYLGAHPHDGGAFQYCQVMLDAVCSLPGDKFEVVAAYGGNLWPKHLSRYSNIRYIKINHGYVGRGIGHLWRRFDLPMETWRSINPLFHPIARALKGEHCDLWLFPAGDGWAYEIDTPALGVMHDLMHRFGPRFNEAHARQEYRRREMHFSNIAKFAQGILVDSEIGKQHAVSAYGINEAKLHILPFIAPKYMSENKATNDFADRYGHSLPKKFIFYPAQFWEHKSHKNLIKAVALLRPLLPDIKLVFVGSQKNGYSVVEKLVYDLNLHNDVVFLGYVDQKDMPELYRRARALIMPTFYGPTNIPPLEAFVAGCPVASSNVYAMAEQVGDAGLLFDPHSLQEIAKAVFRLWTDDKLCEELRQKGYERAKAWNQMAFNHRFYDIVQQILV